MTEVQGLAEFEARFAAIPEKVRAAVATAMEEIAAQLVADMMSKRPLTEITIGWTWGDAPKGSLTLGSVSGREYGGMKITIYASALIDGTDFPAIAQWFEFGTKERYQKSGKFTGKITTQPFFYPVWRARKRWIKGKITRAINKALRES